MYCKILHQTPQSVKILFLPINEINYADDLSKLGVSQRTLLKTEFKDYSEFLKLQFSDLPAHGLRSMESACDFRLTAYFPIIYRSLSATIDRMLQAQIESVFDPFDLLQKPESSELEINRYIKKGASITLDPPILINITDQYILSWANENMVERREKYIKSKIKP